jgi:hypothetical protein
MISTTITQSLSMGHDICTKIGNKLGTNVLWCHAGASWIDEHNILTLAI